MTAERLPYWSTPGNVHFWLESVEYVLLWMFLHKFVSQNHRKV